jgi:hypothetical protein
MTEDAPVRRVRQGGFRGYLCWDPDRVSETVNMDAASPAASTLLAVHHSARIRRRAVGSTDEGELVSEREVLQHFLDRSHQLMILPILGESGTGKSHLVQWLRAQLEEVPTRRVIYVPRSGTGLRGLIELILDQMEGSDAIRLRQELARAFSSTDRTVLPVQLLDAIAQEVPNVADQGVQGRELRRRRGLATLLPPLLRDEVFRRWFLRPGGVIERFVDAVLDEGVRPVDERSGFAFTMEDFPEPDRLDDFEEIGGYAARAFSEVSSAPVFRQAAAALVTDALERAIPKVFGLTGEITLDSVFRETRRILGERGVELILLIEDLTRFQGVDRDLVDALLEPPFQDGRRVLCDLRAAVAVTTGYFGRFLDTFATRAQYAGFEFLLDAPYGDASRGWSDEDVADFVSRYLNATRVGADELRRQYEQAGPVARAESSWIPSGCDDCPHRAICHEAFGEVDGRGLYPFNPPALRATAASVFSAGRFDPRGLLGRVVHATLATHADDLQQGRFPSRAFAMAFPDAPPLPGTTTTAAGLHPDRDRREVLLRFWGGAPDRLEDLDPGIHTAFTLRPVGVTREGAPAEAPQPRRRQERPEPKPSPSRSLGEFVDRWASGQPLPRHATQELQRLVYRAVVDAVPWAALGVRPNHPYLVESTKARIFRQHSVHIEDGLGTERAATTVTITLTRDERDLLHFLARAQELGAATALGAHGYVVLRSFVDQLASRVAKAIAREVDPESPESKVGVLADRLAIGALALGVDSAYNEPLELARSVLDNPAHQRRATSATRWSDFVNEFSDERPDAQAHLVDLASTRQGATGQPSAYRIGRVARSLRKLAIGWDPRTARELPDGFHTRLSRISQRDLKVVADDEIRRLIELAEALRLLLGDQTLEREGFLQALSTAVDDAEGVGCLPGNPMEFRRLIELLSHAPLEEWRTLAERLPEPDTHTGARLARIAEIHKLNPQLGIDLLKQLDDALRTAEDTMRHRLDQLTQGGSESPLDLMINAARRLETSLHPEVGS